MTENVKKIFELLRTQRFIISNEKSVQAEMERVFKANGFNHIREYDLDEQSTIDFLMDDGIGIEVKIKGQKRAIYNQCLRYSKIPKIQQLILVTSVSTGMPNALNGKPIYILNLSKAWL